MSIRLEEIGESGFVKVFDDTEYLGVLHEHDGRVRTYGTRLGLDFQPVSVEREWPTRAEAVAWLFDGAGVEA